MSYWPFWATGLALAAIPLLHWLLLRRIFAVSGRVTAINDGLRAARSKDVVAEAEMSEADMVAALREATAAAFGGGAVVAEVAAPVEPPAPAAPPLPKQKALDHALFLASIVAGGALSAALGGGFASDHVSMGTVFSKVFGDGLAVTAAVLFGGGLLVGFGTRMAGGCTSGHGLCGVSRFQPGSLIATCAFFGAGILVSLLLGALA